VWYVENGFHLVTATGHPIRNEWLRSNGIKLARLHCETGTIGSMFYCQYHLLCEAVTGNSGHMVCEGEY
jgi:hypothetical protein